jgi:hypothetical protein
MKERTAAQSLMIFLKGWRNGANAAAYDDTRVNDPDFWPGYQLGRAAAQRAYAEACKLYDTTLSPLRESEELNKTTTTWDGIEVADDPDTKSALHLKVFRPRWPDGLKSREFYEVPCDDKGRNGGTWLRVMVADDGDVHVSMQEWERIPEGQPDPLPSIRIRTLAGGGRHGRTRQALLWLAKAIELDNADPT